MSRQILIVAFVATVFCGTQTQSVYAMRAELKRPGIAIPTTGAEDQPDATVVAMNKVLQSQEKQFAGGHFINARTVLQFNGGIRTINALLDELSKIEGAVVRVRFSKESGSVNSPFIDKAKQPKICDCAIEHNGWGDAHALTITIYTGGDDLDLDDLVIPALRGHDDAK
jgi:hypothetical protein